MRNHDLCVRLHLVSVPFRPSEAVTLAARRLRAAREALGMEQKEIALAAGAQPNRWNNWERGISLPDPLVMARCQVLFGISLDWIYVGDPGHLPTKVFHHIQLKAPELVAGARLQIDGEAEDVRPPAISPGRAGQRRSG